MSTQNLFKVEGGQCDSSQGNDLSSNSGSGTIDEHPLVVHDVDDCGQFALVIAVVDSHDSTDLHELCETLVV